MRFAAFINGRCILAGEGGVYAFFCLLMYGKRGAFICRDESVEEFWGLCQLFIPSFFELLCFRLFYGLQRSSDTFPTIL